MKKHYLIILYAFILSSLVSCQEDFLERKPQGTLIAGNYPSTSDEAIIATNGIYNTLRVWQLNTGGFPLLDIMSDEAVKGSNAGDGIQVNEFNDFTFTSDNGNIENWYRTLYLGIRRSYLVSEKVPNIRMDTDLQNRLLGEAAFLRAYFYSILIRGFGDVPMVTSFETPENLKRTDKDIIFKGLVETELLSAIDNLPEKSDYTSEDAGRVTKGAARALLARMYLFRRDFENAEIYALEVINSSQYNLENDFADAFSVVGEFGTESVFEIGALPEGSFTLGGNQYANTQGVRGTPNWGWGFGRPDYSWIVEMQNDGDPRLDPSVIFLGETVGGVTVSGDGSTNDTTYADGPGSEIVEIEVYNQKVFASGDDNASRWGYNRRIIRYADVLLMAAEALNENNKSNQALQYLNQVRERARANNENILPDINETNQDILRGIILKERNKELFMEGLRFWDLIRTNRASEILGPLGFETGKHELFPIPESEIAISGGVITQNDNWN